MTDCIEAFSEHDAWNAFVGENDFVTDPDYISSIVEHATTYGVDSAFLGRVGPEQVAVGDTNYRESLIACGLSSRQRAIMELMASEAWFDTPRTAKIYAAEALTPFALMMRSRFPRFIGSEYASNDAAREALYPIEYQDLTNLTLRSDTFDCVITNDVLEHVADIGRCLEEMARVLRPGVVMLSTFPFAYRYENIVKARLVDGVVEHLMEPEYHGNPAEPEKGSLVFEIPGWQILDTARDAGFSRSEMIFLSSLEKGITGAEIAGILVFRCHR